MARILVIDDESNIRLMIRLALQHAGHEVDTAADGLEGLDKFGAGAAWDLVLLDQRMPGSDGLSVLKVIMLRDPDARVVMITAFGTIDLALEAMKAGARDLLRKPFTGATLRGAVEAALERVASPQTGVAPVTFGLTTINGYHIAYPSEVDLKRNADGDLAFCFSVRSPTGVSSNCEVHLPVYVQELVRAHADRDRFPGETRFWQALCEEALANYLWQHAESPPGGTMQVDDLGAGLRRWVDVVLSAGV